MRYCLIRFGHPEGTYFSRSLPHVCFWQLNGAEELQRRRWTQCWIILIDYVLQSKFHFMDTIVMRLGCSTKMKNKKVTRGRIDKIRFGFDFFFLFAVWRLLLPTCNGLMSWIFNLSSPRTIRTMFIHVHTRKMSASAVWASVCACIVPLSHASCENISASLSGYRMAKLFASWENFELWAFRMGQTCNPSTHGMCMLGQATVGKSKQTNPRRFKSYVHRNSWAIYGVWLPWLAST